MPRDSFQLINKSGNLERIEIEDGSVWHGQFVPFVPNRVLHQFLGPKFCFERDVFAVRKALELLSSRIPGRGLKLQATISGLEVGPNPYEEKTP